MMNTIYLILAITFLTVSIIWILIRDREEDGPTESAVDFIFFDGFFTAIGGFFKAMGALFQKPSIKNTPEWILVFGLVFLILWLAT